MIDTRAKLAEKLGLTPSAMGKLRKERPIDLAAAFAESDDSEAD
jgi:hypothetical protein